MLKQISDGTTLHSAFDFNFGNEHLPLPDQKLAKFRDNLQYLQIVIIDEISFIKPDMLYKIHLRLCEVFQTKELFGGRTIIAVGDLLQVNYYKLVFQISIKHFKHFVLLF